MRGITVAFVETSSCI